MLSLFFYISHFDSLNVIFYKYLYLNKVIIIFVNMIKFGLICLLAMIILMSLQSAIINQDGLSLTIYTNNLGIVKDRRTIQCDQGESLLKFAEFSNQFQRNTLTFRSISHSKSVKLVEEEYVRPHVEWIIQSDRSQLSQCQIGYRSLGFSWSVDYTLQIDEGEKVADFIGWATIINKSGKDYWNTSIKLVSGNLNVIEKQPTNIQQNLNRISQMRTTQNIVRQRSSRFDYQEEAQENPFTRSQLADYHSFKLNRNFTIKNGNQKRVQFIQKIKNISIEKEYEIRIQAGGRNQQNIRGISMIKIANHRNNSLGFYLPEGTVRIFQEDRVDKFLQFSADTKTSGVTQNKRMILNEGQVFDVFGEKRVLSKNQVKNEFNTTDFNATCNIKITNSKSIPITIILKFSNGYGDQWTVAQSKNNANSIFASVDITPQKISTSQYRIATKLGAGEIWEYEWKEILKRTK